MSPPGAVTPGQMPAHYNMPPSPSPIPNQMAMAGYVDARMQGAHALYQAADLIDDKSLPMNSKPSRAPKLAPLDVFPDGPRDRSDNRQEEEVKFGGSAPMHVKFGGWVVDRRLDLAAVRERAWLEAAADMQAAALSGEWKVPERLRSTLQEVLAGPA
jgi:hypothetical protein